MPSDVGRGRRLDPRGKRARVHRGVAYWTDGREERIFIGTGNAYLIALDAIPQPGEVGNETWERESWKTVGGVNVWAPMSADEELGYLYLPVSTPANDYYGGHRHGDNLFAESLVCVDAATGRRVWHFQLVRHPLWDYDLPAAPNLVDLTVNGQRIKAVAQVTKQGFVYVFDRVTGRPVWPVEDRPVPQSTVPGEKTAATQPFPTRPAPFERQGVRQEDVIDFTPELRRQALAILDRHDSGPLYTPPSERGTIFLPGQSGGASWAGAAVDPATGWLYVTSRTFPIVTTLSRPSPIVQLADRYVGEPQPLFGPEGLPLFKPPFGRRVAIDLNTGDHAWTVPLGEGPRKHPRLAPLGLPRLGSPRRGFPLVTRTLLFAAQEGRPHDRPWVQIWTFAPLEPTPEVFDKTTGELLAQIELPANAHGALMTYMVGGRQYIVVPVGGANLPAELLALSLP